MMKLYFVTLAIFVLGAYSVESFDPEIPSNLEENEVVKKFVEIVNKHNLEVTIMATQNDYIDDGVEVKAYTLTFPHNMENENNTTVQKHPSDITEAEAKEFLTFAAKHKLVAKTNVGSEDVEYNNNKYQEDYDVVPDFFKTKAAVDGHTIKDKDYYAQYNFVIPGPDGKNETYIALIGNVENKLIENSGLSEEVISYLNELNQKLAMNVQDDSELPEIYVNILSKKFPKENWQVLVNPGNYYIGDHKKAVFQVGQLENDNKIVIFTI